MENLIIIAVLAVLIGGACLYLYKAKKKGQACIGCPYSKQCGKSKKNSCGSK